MIKFTDPTYSDFYFVVIDKCVYIVEKYNLNEFLHHIHNNNIPRIKDYIFSLKRLGPEENHFHVIFDKLNTPLIRLLFHE